MNGQLSCQDNIQVNLMFRVKLWTGLKTRVYHT